MNLSASFWLLLQGALWSGLASTGFALLFNVPLRTLPACAFCGAAGYLIRTTAVQLGLGIEAATLAGATGVGLLGSLFARYWRISVPVFTAPGVIPLIPGTFAFNTMIGLLNLATAGPNVVAALLQETIVDAVKTALILGAIASGLAAPSLLFHRPPPVV